MTPAQVSPFPKTVLISNLLKIATSLFGLFKGAAAIDKAKAEGLAGLSEKISGCLVATSTALRAGQVPHGECAKLLMYSEELPALLSGVVRDDVAEGLAELLRESHRVEGLSVQIAADLSTSATHIAHLDEAAGRFQACADLLRAGALSG